MPNEQKSSTGLIVGIIVVVVLIVGGVYAYRTKNASDEAAPAKTYTVTEKGDMKTSATTELNTINSDYKDSDYTLLDKGL